MAGLTVEFRVKSFDDSTELTEGRKQDFSLAFGEN